MGKRILAIDDNEDILDTLNLILSLEGYEIHASLSPENIGNDIFNFKPDLILLDIQMGIYNGLDVCKKLKSNLHTQNIPVIIISSDESIEKAITEYSADDTIMKPFDISQLIHKVSKYLEAKVITLKRASA